MRSRLLLLTALLLAADGVRSGEGEVRLLTDDAIPRYLARGQELARAEQWEKVVDVLQRVVVGDPEVFPDLKPEVLHSAVYSDDGVLFYPARELCLKELAKLPPEGLRAYRDAFDKDARDLYAKADAVAEMEQRLASYAEVYDRFLVSTVGDDALEKAGDLNLSLGRYYESLALFRRLIDLYPKDTDRDVATVLAKAAYCAARIGDVEHRDVLLERLASEHPTARVKIEGKSVGSAALKEHPLLRVRAEGVSTSRGDWPVAGGNPSRSRIGEDLPEDLPAKPFWSFALRERDARLTALYGFWHVAMHDREPTGRPDLSPPTMTPVRPYPTVRPVVHDGLVMYKDYIETVPRRIGSGTMAHIWGRIHPVLEAKDDVKYLYPVALVRPGSQTDAKAFETIYRYFEYGGNTLVAHGNRFITVEPIRYRNGYNMPSELRTVVPPARPTPNMLVAYDRRTGKTMWGWEQDLCAAKVRKDKNLHDAWQKDFQAHPAPMFTGPGVVVGGTLYTIVREQEDLSGVSLWAVNVDDGRIRYRTPLHYRDEVRQRVPRGSALAVAGGVVYAVTHAGVVAAIDALPPGRVRWIRRYNRNYQRSTSRRRRGPGMVTQTFAYNEPIVSGGKVIVAAPDAAEIVALDAETGRLVWSIPKRALGQVAHVVGVSEGVVVLAGDKILAVDLAKGDRVWGPLDPELWPFGRGFVSRKYAYLPTMDDRNRRAAVERFDLLTGERRPSLRFNVKKLGNILCVDGRLIAATDEEVMCFTSLSAEIGRLDKRLLQEGERSELRLERALVALTASSTNRDQAREDLGRAVTLAVREQNSNEVRIRGHALHNVIELARERTDLNALAEARALVKPLAADRDGFSDPALPYRAQIALVEAEILGKLGRGEEALGALERYLDDYGHVRVVMQDRVVDPRVAVNTLRGRLLSTNAAFRAAFAKSVLGRIDAAYKAKDKEALEAIPARYGNRPPSEQSFFTLARLCAEQNRVEEAKSVLRRFIREFDSHRRRAEAHLHLAKLLSKEGDVVRARHELNEAIARLDEQGRRDNADLIADLAKMLPRPGRAAARTRVRIPLAAKALDITNATPVRIEGDPPEDLRGISLFANADSYVLLGPDGTVLWKQPNPAGRGPEPGPAGEPTTAVVAARIAAARFARFVGEELVLADVTGAMRVRARSGQVRWKQPQNPVRAAEEAAQAIAALRADLGAVRRDGHALRKHPLPAYALADRILVRVHPSIGVQAFQIEDGKIVWQDKEVRSVPAGPPDVMGKLVAVGWSKPGRIRVYEARSGRITNDHEVRKSRTDPGGVLLAPPVLDPLGRLVAITSPQPDGSLGRVEILNARDFPAARNVYPVRTTYASILHADGRLIVYHDGSSGTDNLHFLDLENNRNVARKAPDMLREFDLIRDGYRLFVFTHTPGLEDEGARLFRVDLKSTDILAYRFPPKAAAYARPVLTQRYIAVLGSQARRAHVRIYDREASVETGSPQPVFAAPGGRETSELDFDPTAQTRYAVAPSIAVSGDGLVVGHPFGAARLQARDAR